VLNEKIRSRKAKFSALEIYENFYADAEQAYLNLFEQRVNNIDSKREFSALVEKIVSGVNAKTRCLFEIITNVDFGDRFVSHSVKTAIISVSIGKSLNLPEKNLIPLATGALLHDIGRSQSKNMYLNSYIPNFENVHDRELAHSEISSTVIADFFGFGAEAAQIARNHHEQLDGNGYPRKLCAKDIRPLDRIVFTANFIENLLEKTNFDGMEKLHAAMLYSYSKFPWKFDLSVHDAFLGFAEKPVVSRRRHERTEVNSVAHYRKFDSESKVPSRILDISEGGVRMQCREDLCVGSLLSVSFALHQGTPVHNAPCKVVRSNTEEKGFTYGLAFQSEMLISNQRPHSEAAR
jgi:putative nucleotidyltransferase with HDIG domain